MTTSIRENPSFTFSELPVLLGRGGHASVVLGTLNGITACPNSTTLCAIKKNQKYPSIGLREADILKSLNNPYILSYYGQFLDKKSSTHRLVTQYCPSNAVHWIKHGLFAKACHFSKLCRQLSIGVAYLHEKNILHLDIKPNNILIDRVGTIKLADFSAAVIGTKTFISKNQPFGTFPYRSPEGLLNNQYGTESDLFSFGITVLTAKCQRPPIFEKTEEDQKLKVRSAIKTGTFKTKFSVSNESFVSANSSEEKSMKKLKSVVNDCLALDPTRRPNAKQLVLAIHACLEDRGNSNTSTTLPQKQVDKYPAVLPPIPNSTVNYGKN